MTRACVFFFSSRRRHTRCSRDWSSDVCSSDLEPHRAALGKRLITAPDADALGPRLKTALVGNEIVLLKASRGVALERVRSEERRVGKECRSLWWPER